MEQNKKQIILILQGIPASGKSTFARNFIEGKEDWIIVNRDSIRNSLGKYWQPSRENLVSTIEKYEIIEGLKAGFNVILDATNLNPKFLHEMEELVKDFDVTIEKKFFSVSLEEAIKRDKLRLAPVGEEVIRRFYKNYIKEPKIKNEKDRFYVPQVGKPFAFIFDIDGTTALMDRIPYDYSRVLEDAPNVPMVKLIKYLSDNYPIIFLSGRDGSCKEDTKKWIEREIGLPEYELFMRKEKDSRSDNIIKKELYEEFIKPNYSILAWIDDRDQVVKMVREELGILCLQCWPGNF